MSEEFEQPKPTFKQKPLFTRVKRAFPKEEQPDGNGFACGCRKPDDFTPRGFWSHINLLNKVAKELMPAVPGWVPVEPSGNIVSESREVQGTLLRSFQTWTDFPLRQWHRWYDWNFHVEPDPEYQYIRGKGNSDAPKVSHEMPLIGGIPVIGPLANLLKKGFDFVYDKIHNFIWPKRRVVGTEAMECEWDSGSFGPGQGLMFDPEFVKKGFWPQTGQRVWIAGRWIYDCGHASAHNLHRTELHPCLAMACARIEAIPFEKDCKALWPDAAAGQPIGFQTYNLPAHQFLFFTSRSGGYKNFPDLGNEDYTFIVELPEFETKRMRWPLGRTVEFPLNTGTLRDAKLVYKVDFTPFERAVCEPVKKDASTGPAVNDGDDPCYKVRKPACKIEPKIEVLKPEKGDVPRQVKVTVPISQIPKTEDAYGFVLTLAYYDSANVQAKKVKKCTVEVDHIFKAAINHDTLAEEWNVKLCVNGRWFLFEDNDVHNNSDLPLKKEFHFMLAEGDPILISAHGAEIDLVGDVYYWDLSKRWLTVEPEDAPEQRADWEEHIVGKLHDHSWASHVAYRVFTKMLTTLNDQNDPLGQIDPGYGTPGEQKINPFYIKGPLQRKEFKLQALETQEVGSSAELVELKNSLDWRLHYFITVEDVNIP
jgi:hypothetical protein